MKEIKLQEHTYILKNVTASRKSACEVSTVKDILMILKCPPINQIEVSIMLHITANTRSDANSPATG